MSPIVVPERATPPPELLPTAPSPEVVAKIVATEPHLGMKRRELMEWAGPCLRRTVFTPGGGGRLSAEVFQPKAGACMEKLGARRFMVIGEKLDEILPGVDAEPPESRPLPTTERNAR